MYEIFIRVFGLFMYLGFAFILGGILTFKIWMHYFKKLPEPEEGSFRPSLNDWIDENKKFTFHDDILVLHSSNYGHGFKKARNEEYPVFRVLYWDILGESP